MEMEMLQIPNLDVSTVGGDHSNGVSPISSGQGIQIHTPGSGRFRVDRLNSLVVGCSNRTTTEINSISGGIGNKRSSIVILEEDETSDQYLSPESTQITRVAHGNLKYNNNNPRSSHIFNLNNNNDNNNNFNMSTTTSGLQHHTGGTTHGSNSGVARKISTGVNPNKARRKSSIFLPDIDELNLAQCNSTFGVYGKSLENCTQDALPKMNNYRNLLSLQAATRPTLDDLHAEVLREKGAIIPEDPDAANVSTGVKFGWIEGCLVRCLLNIWGVMLFLRLSWMVAQAGLIESMIIIFISTVVTGVTTLSMSAVSTNGEMKGGGLYYMISRTLGPEWGGSIGVVFSFANAGMAALNIVGFSEAVIALMKSQGVMIVDGGQNDNRIISCCAIVLLQSIIIIGMEWEAKAQVGLLVILLVAMGDFVIGAFVGPLNNESISKGWIGLNSTLFIENLQPGYIVAEGMQQNFFTIFSIFFPAVAGIQAGASISGDLKDPAKAIPAGTLLAIFITSASYAAFALLAGAGTLREASGIEAQAVNGSWEFANCTVIKCEWGLYNDYQVMQLMSIFGPVIYAGCFAATLSSALSCLVSGAKTFQALCKDKVYPYLTRFGVGYGKTDDPYWTYALGFVIALVFILIADLNAIAPLISNFFMVAYALLNACAFHASLIKPLGWRPTFKYYNTWVSLFGAIVCFVIMFLMSWQTALISLGCVIALYLIVLYRKPELNWGTSIQAQTFSAALTALQTLSTQAIHVKNYRPQILCMTGYPNARPALVDFANLLTKKTSLLICANINEERVQSFLRKVIIQNGYDWLQARKIKAFYVTVDSCKFDEGCQALLQSTGIGKLAPNILLLGYKGNWQLCPPQEVKEYFNCLHQALDNYMAISILRIKDGIDCSHLMTPQEQTLSVPSNLTGKDGRNTHPGVSSNKGYHNTMDYDPTDPEAGAGGKPNMAPATKKGNKLVFNEKNNKDEDSIDSTGIYRDSNDGENSTAATNPSIFQTEQGKGVIDVWWLYDDGGLTLLLPYILTMRKNWALCRLRVFALANKKTEIEVDRRSMASLLSKFRIDYSDLTVIPDVTMKAGNESRALFESLIKDFKGDPDKCDDPETIISESELLGLREKTNRQMRLRELLLEHSSQSNLIVMTLPVPRKGTVSAPLYMAWLELLTRDMPPILLVRGNQTSVLTFYS